MSSNDLNNFVIPGTNFGYTGVPIDDLASIDNTIVTSFFDESGSTRRYATDMEKCIQEIVKSLRHCPAADKLIYRQVHFDNQIREYHGFKSLVDCNESDYEGCWSGGGTTNLYGCAEEVIRTTIDYAEEQSKKRYNVNAIIYGITDGCHYTPGEPEFTEDKVKEAMRTAIDCEALESIMTILIGVNDDHRIQKNLEQFASNVGFTQYVPMKEADEKSLAKLGNFISQSVQSQSSCLGTGGPSQSLTF